MCWGGGRMLLLRLYCAWSIMAASSAVCRRPSSLQPAQSMILTFVLPHALSRSESWRLYTWNKVTSTLRMVESSPSYLCDEIGSQLRYYTYGLFLVSLWYIAPPNCGIGFAHCIKRGTPVTLCGPSFRLSRLHCCVYWRVLSWMFDWRRLRLRTPVKRSVQKDIGLV